MRYYELKRSHSFDENIMEMINIFINELFFTDTGTKLNKSYVIWVAKCVQIVNAKIVEILYEKDDVIHNFEKVCREELTDIKGGEDESTT